MAPSTESLPAPWIRVRVVVELKTDSNSTYLPERDGSRSPDSSVIPPQRRFSALHDKDGRCVEPKHLNLSAFLSHSLYENSWQSFGDFEGGDDGQNRRRKSHLHQRRSSRRDAICTRWMDYMKRLRPHPLCRGLTRRCLEIRKKMHHPLLPPLSIAFKSPPVTPT